MQYSNNLITRLIEYINEDDALSEHGIAIRAYDTKGLPVPISKTYFSFSCKENSTVFSYDEENQPLESTSITIKMSCFSPLKDSAHMAHAMTEKVISALCMKFRESISAFTIGETDYDDDVKSYKITSLIYFSYFQ